MMGHTYFLGDIQEGEHLPVGRRVCGLAWPILGRLGRLDPSSNLGRPTLTNPIFAEIFLFF